MNVQLAFCVWRVECPETDSVVLTARHEFVGGGGKRNTGYRFCVASVVADVRVVMGGEVTNRIFLKLSVHAKSSSSVSPYRLLLY